MFCCVGFGWETNKSEIPGVVSWPVVENTHRPHTQTGGRTIFGKTQRQTNNQTYTKYIVVEKHSPSSQTQEEEHRGRLLGRLRGRLTIKHTQKTDKIHSFLAAPLFLDPRHSISVSLFVHVKIWF